MKLSKGLKKLERKKPHNKPNKVFNSLCDNWFFIRQDIVSYLISTILYITLCLSKNFTVHSFVYGLFDCLVFYLPFWYIRIAFSDTYHSDKWEHCRKWTRIMLCSGAIVMFILPFPYTVFNGLFVAFGCCLILYLVALEVNEKKEIKRENKRLTNELMLALKQEPSPKEKLLKMCEEKNISERDTKIALMYYIDRKKPKQIWEWLCENHENMEYDSVYILLNRLNKKLK